MLQSASSEANSMSTALLTTTNYARAEQEFTKLLEMEELDKKIDAQPSLVSNFEKVLVTALIDAYEQEPSDDAAHRFLQRILYRINRLKLFWYDDLRHYTNERSLYLRTVRDKIEAPWQQWELSQFDVPALQQLDVKQALIERAAAALRKGRRH